MGLGRSIPTNKIISGKIAEIDLSFLGLTQGAYVLDVGCARGYTLAELSKRGCLAYGVEVLFDLVREALQTLEKTQSGGFPVAGSAMSLPFSNETFDAVVCTEVIEHVPNAERALSEIYRVLKPRGHLCLALPTWFTERLFNRLDPNFATHSGHLRIFGPGEMKQLLELHGFKILRMHGRYFEWSVYWLFRTLFLKTEPVFYEDARKYERLDHLYKRMWRAADRLKIGKLVKAAGNCVFPKSHYFYGYKP